MAFSHAMHHNSRAMKASTAVTLVLASSMSIFGLHSCTHNDAYASVEPVWVNGVMGVYYPGTQIFVPSTSPVFDQTCNLIQQQRDQQYGTGGGGGFWSTGYNHHWVYYPGSRVFAYSQGGATAAENEYWGNSHSGSSFFGGSSSHFGSARGGIGGFGEGHGGGGHGGGE